MPRWARTQRPNSRFSPDRQVGKQAALLGRHNRPGADGSGDRIPSSVSVSTDPSTTIRPLCGEITTRDRIDHRGLAASGATEQRRQTASAAEMDIEREGSEPMLDIDFEHRLSRWKDVG